MHRAVDFPNKNCHMNYCGCKRPRTDSFTVRCAPVPLTKVQVKGILLQRCHTNNGDLRLSRQDVQKAFDYLGSHFPNWRACRAFHHADANGDGYISEGEMDDLVEYVWQCGYTIN
ncbi:hypothetical protein COLO4_26499 [Corchorus olitorius]|uniref:EF-hand domain-containing protein n=1 Tax=Corchorus olitorius TaxID=93759 RepID=A0A1R3HWR2_9ROSI|nr:hypothetical protein COLO4_26499 [Corchorus olitorius]